MRRTLIAFAVATLAASPIAAFAQTDVMATVNRFVEAFNKGDTMTVRAVPATCLTPPDRGALSGSTSGPLAQRRRGVAARGGVLDAWEQHGDAPRDTHPWRHPARAARHAIATVRRVARGLPSPARQREALPLLLRLALGDEGSAWLHPTIARLLRLPPTDPSDLTTLIHRFLFACDSGDAASAPAPEVQAVAPGWGDPLPIRLP